MMARNPANPFFHTSTQVFRQEYIATMSINSRMGKEIATASRGETKTAKTGVARKPKPPPKPDLEMPTIKTENGTRTHDKGWARNISIMAGGL